VNSVRAPEHDPHVIAFIGAALLYAGALIRRSSVSFPIGNSELLSRPFVQARIHLIFHVTDPLGSARGLDRRPHQCGQDIGYVEVP
jgi:hypothetical protein